MILEVISIISFIFGFFIFWSKIDVTSKTQVNTKNILSTDFELVNNSKTPIRNIKTFWLIYDLKTSDGFTMNTPRVNTNKGGLTNGKNIKILYPGKKTTISIPPGFFIGNNTRFVDLGVRIEFNLFFILTCKSMFSFLASERSNGELYWRPKDF